MVIAPPAEAAAEADKAARSADNRAYVRFLLALRLPQLSRELEARRPRCPRCGQ